MQTIVLYLCYIVLILLFSYAYNTSLIYCFVIWCLHTYKRRPCSSTLSGHPSSSLKVAEKKLWFIVDITYIIYIYSFHMYSYVFIGSLFYKCSILNIAMLVITRGYISLWLLWSYRGRSDESRLPRLSPAGRSGEAAKPLPKINAELFTRDSSHFWHFFASKKERFPCPILSDFLRFRPVKLGPKGLDTWGEQNLIHFIPSN